MLYALLCSRGGVSCEPSYFALSCGDVGCGFESEILPEDRRKFDVQVERDTESLKEDLDDANKDLNKLQRQVDKDYAKLQKIVGKAEASAVPYFSRMFG